MSALSAVLAAREQLKTLTPLKTDCGRLCAGACCQGDEQTGMLLFPGEEALYEGCTFGRVIDGEFSLGGAQAKLFVCCGTCDRDNRPLACRLFPLFLTFKEDGSTKLRIDRPRKKAEQSFVKIPPITASARTNHADILSSAAASPEKSFDSPTRLKRLKRAVIKPPSAIDMAVNVRAGTMARLNRLPLKKAIALSTAQAIMSHISAPSPSNGINRAEQAYIPPKAAAIKKRSTDTCSHKSFAVRYRHKKSMLKFIRKNRSM